MLVMRLVASEAAVQLSFLPESRFIYRVYQYNFEI